MYTFTGQCFMLTSFLESSRSFRPIYTARYKNLRHTIATILTFEMFISLTTHCFPSDLRLTNRAFPNDPSPILRIRT